MKTQLTLVFILISFSFSNILNVNGEEYSTIQSAIDDAVTGDTVLVHQGLYYENLDINKTITLTSLAMYDNLDTWYEYDPLTAQYEINNDNILNTIIDASEPLDTNFTSGIVIRSSEDECIAPTITGFTIEWGTGTRVDRDPDPDNIEYQRLGGGILVAWADPIIEYNKISYNRVDISSGSSITTTIELSDLFKAIIFFSFAKSSESRAVTSKSDFKISSTSIIL